METLIDSQPNGIDKIHLFLLGAGLILSYLLLVAIYRLTFHPLARYPGPLFSKLSSWSIVFQAASGNRHLLSWREHEKYGPIVRIGPNAISINTVAGLKAVYGSRGANVQKSDWYRTIDAASGEFSTHSVIDRQKHAFRRRVIDQAFSEIALESAERFVIENVKAWCNHLTSGAEKPGQWAPAKNMNDWCTYLGYDIMGNLVFGKNFRCMESEEHRYVPKLMMSGTKMIYIAGFLPFISMIRPLLGTRVMGLLGGQNARDNAKYVEYANSQMAQRIAAEGGASELGAKRDLSHYLLHAQDPQTGKAFSTDELNADSSLFISAGSDTTALTLAGTLFYILHNPETLKKLEVEIRTRFASRDEINSKALNNIPYLRACIDETLRLCPAVPSHLPREVLPGGLMIGEHYFPAGTVIGTSAYAIHHNKEYYPHPFSYRPERWIVDPKSTNDDELRSPKRVSNARAAFFPFSIGPRGCAGKTLAYREMMYALAMLLFSYDIRLAHGRGPSGGGDPNHKNQDRRRLDEYQLEEYFVPYRDGPMVEFRERI